MKSILALALACFAAGAASIAMAQVGLGGGVVGTLGANGSASRFGGIGSGISTGTTMRGEELRQTGQLSAETRGQALPPTTGNAGGAANTDVKKVEQKRDQLEDHGDKTVDKALQ